MSAEIAATQSTPTGAMIRTLGLVATICGLIIVGAYQGTFTAVQDNKRIALERAVVKVLPGAESISALNVSAQGVQPAVEGNTPAGSVNFYAAYDSGGALIGVAAEAAGRGYADLVRILYGYKTECKCIVGIGVVSMRETPGIGDKILTDKEFLANFTALDVKLNADMKALANAVKVVKHGTKTSPWQIDAISGATVTSKAVGKGINESAQALLPLLEPQIEKLRRKS
jgi:Na+-translocating ferredoxin:NAD+ oxidoreductase subunit G